MSGTVLTRAGSSRLGSTITVTGTPTGATVNQGLRGALFGFGDQAAAGLVSASVAAAGATINMRRMDGSIGYTPVKAGAPDGTHPTLGQSGSYSYDFTILNAELALATAEGATEIMMSLDYCPQILGGTLPPSTATTVTKTSGWYVGPNGNPPSSNSAFATMCADHAYHATVTRGANIVYWGLWNEPDGGYFTGTVAQYFALYGAVAPALKAVNPAFKVGGPEIAALTPATATTWMTGLMNYCRVNAVPLDFLSWHSYEARGVDVSYFIRLLAASRTAAAWIGPLDYLIGEYAGATIINWPGYGGPFGESLTERLPVNDQGAAITAIQLMEFQEYAIKRAVFFKSYPEPSSGGGVGHNGLFNENGATATGNVLRMWERIGAASVLSTTLTADPGIRAMAAQRAGTIYVLVASHHYRRDSRFAVTVALPGVADGRACTMRVIDRARSNQQDAGTSNAALQTVPVGAFSGGRVELSVAARSVSLLEIAP